MALGVTMQKDLMGPWERVRQGLITDLEQLEASINTRFATVFNPAGLVEVPSGGTGAATFTPHGILVGQGTNAVISVSGSGVLHLTPAADPTVSPVVETDLGLSDITTADVTSTKHGLAPKSPADATKFLNGAGTNSYAQVKDADLALTDILTNDVSITKHGFTPKLPNDPTKFLAGDGTWQAGGAGMPSVGGTAAAGKRVLWAQKSDAANNSTMQAVGMQAPSVTGGIGTLDNSGFWATPQGAAGGQAVFTPAAAVTRVNLLPKMIVRLRTPAAITNLRLVVALNKSLALVTSDAPSLTTETGIYVRYSTAVPDGGWVVQTVDGSGRSVSSTILAIAASTIYVITITVLTTTSVKVDINGTAVTVSANIILATNLGPVLWVKDLSGAVAPSFDLQSVYIETQ